jgi:hypothetical protein
VPESTPDLTASPANQASLADDLFGEWFGEVELTSTQSQTEPIPQIPEGISESQPSRVTDVMNLDLGDRAALTNPIANPIAGTITPTTAPTTVATGEKGLETGADSEIVEAVARLPNVVPNIVPEVLPEAPLLSPSDALKFLHQWEIRWDPANPIAPPGPT